MGRRLDSPVCTAAVVRDHWLLRGSGIRGLVLGVVVARWTSASADSLCLASLSGTVVTTHLGPKDGCRISDIRPRPGPSLWSRRRSTPRDRRWTADHRAAPADHLGSACWSTARSPPTKSRSHDTANRPRGIDVGRHLESLHEAIYWLSRPGTAEAVAAADPEYATGDHLAR